MSDFLSNFNKENYQKREPRENKDKGPKKDALEQNSPNNSTEQKQPATVEKKEKVVEEAESSKVPDSAVTPAETPMHHRKRSKENQKKTNEKTNHKTKDQSVDQDVTGQRSPKKKKSFFKKKNKEAQEEPTILADGSEFDPTYKRKKIIRWSIIGAILAIVVALGGFGYYQMNHVQLPDFTGESLGDARSWLTENNLQIEVIQEYDDSVAINQVIKQSPNTAKKVKKGSVVTITASKGPDPDAVISMPDFMTMSKAAAEEWKEQNQASNFSIIEEYSDTVEKDQPLRLEFGNKETTRETYQRKEMAKLYISRGKEVFEKNITMPDFTNKLKSEVESWAKTNEISVTYEERANNEVEAGAIIEQSVPKDEKVAKRDALTVAVSLGKAIIVPNFGDYTAEEATSASADLLVLVKTVYSDSATYGKLISQSVPAGTELTANSNTQVEAIYSLGRPYIKDLRGTMVEGDLPKYFFDEYQSKGAQITSQVRYVDSAETKGTVVGMSVFNQYLAMTDSVTFDISKGNLTAPQNYQSDDLDDAAAFE
ncbi:PASTA domain-containing protein [Enterococcus sp. LJL120]